MAKKPWNDAEGKQAYLSTFVKDMWDHCENETKRDRDRWTLAINLFQGKMDWGADRDDQEWMSRPFLHELSRVVRRVADAATSLIFEKDDFFQLESSDPDDPGNEALAKIFEKIVQYDLEEMRLPSMTYEFCIAAGVTGLGVFKVYPCLETKWSADVLLEELDKEEEKRLRPLSGKVEGAFKLPEDPEMLESAVLAELSGFFADSSDKPTRRKIGPKKRLELKIKASIVDPRNYGFNPDSKRIQETPYHIERIDKKFFELEPLFESNTLDRTKRKDLLNSVNTQNRRLSSAVTGRELQKYGTRDQYEQNSRFTPNCELFEYFGPVLNEDGELVDNMENMHIVIGNDNVLLQCRRNPHWNQESVFITTTFSKSPFKPTGQGVADNAIDHQLLMNDLFATFVDMLKLAVYSPMVIDDAALRDPEEVELGMYPGMMIKTFGKKAQDVFSTVPYNVQPGQYLFQTLQQMRTSSEAAAGVDITSVNPSSRSRISASEIQANSSRGDESALALGRELDENFIIPLVKKIIDYRLQYGFDKASLEDLRMLGILTENEYNLVAGIPAVERFNEIKKRYRIRVKGFRERLERQVFLRNVNEFLAQVSQLPPGAQAQLEWKHLLQDITEAFGFDENRWITQSSPQDKAREENKVLINNQRVEVGVDDEDQMELGVHFDAYQKSPAQALLEHIQQHLMRIQERGEPMPQMPPEIAQVLGINPQSQTAYINGAGPVQ